MTMTDNSDNQGLQQQQGDDQRRQAGQQNQQGERQPQQQPQDQQQPQPGQQNQQSDRDRRPGEGVEQIQDDQAGSLGGGNGDLRPGRMGDGGAER